MKTEHITRKQHLNTVPAEGTDAECQAHHRAYYAQLVTPGTVSYVVACIGADNLRASTDPFFNDIPLERWDRLSRIMPITQGGFKRLDDYPTLASLVCVAKEAARQWLES